MSLKKIQEPRSPTHPKPSTSSSINNPTTITRANKLQRTAEEFFNKVRFEPYRSTRPKLLDELHRVIQEGKHSIIAIRDIASSARLEDILHTPTTDDMLDLLYYRSAFQLYIDDCNIYKDVLSEIKQAYETALASYDTDLQKYHTLQIDVRKSESEVNTKMLRFELDMKAKNDIIQKRLIDLQMDCQIKDKTIFRLTEQNIKLEKTCQQSTEEIFEFKKTCITLSKALKVFEEREVTLKDELQQHVDEVRYFTDMQKSNNEEMSNLRLQVQELEAHQADLLPKSAVEQHMVLVSTLQHDLQRVVAADKELLFRYMSMKGAIAKV
jgi:hypothetical protein